MRYVVPMAGSWVTAALLVTSPLLAGVTCLLVLRTHRMLLEARRAFSRQFIPRPAATFGSPEQWEAFAQKRPGFRGAMPRLHKLLEKVFIRTLTDPSDADTAVFYLGRLCVEDFMEILVLCGNGYGLGGKKLLRGLYERALTAWHLHRHPEEAVDFKDYWARPVPPARLRGQGGARGSGGQRRRVGGP